ncbi:hypothetical protein SS50377_22267 [Spironucleus salmonicida]|uniref:TAFII55 protein conserved region domain-containing protein n=1 Tax=Spironucleus salmonicida TaxID=348837 RepID=V6LND5_9EUKA|nr:hypothetical protein SS50377_22267 [Spironucleus salmonicida]|eukprot:EST42239.1 hypothetical protein SS50377_18541 [Spironucleus salmonicida]
MNSLEDDYMFQENYIIEFPDRIAAIANKDPNFDFDLVFDHTGQSGIFNCSQIKPSKMYFRMFPLPLPTELYTSSDASFYYKNSDVSHIIIIYDPQSPPHVFQDYEEFQLAQAALALNKHPFQYNVLPHGLTPPTRWAPFQLYPQIPLRPRFFEFAQGEDISITKDEQQKQVKDSTKKRIQEIEGQTKKTEKALETEKQKNNKAGQQTSDKQDKLIQQLSELRFKLDQLKNDEDTE